MSTTINARNGIDLAQLVETVEAIKEDANLAAFTFRAHSSWRGGTHNVGEISGFTHANQEDESRAAPFVLEGDEPPVLLGDNRGPNAVELLLQALAFCYAVGYVANAAARGIEIARMEYEIEGDFDVRAFLGLDGGRPGFSAIRATAHVSSPNATVEQLEELCSYVQDTSQAEPDAALPAILDGHCPRGMAWHDTACHGIIASWMPHWCWVNRGVSLSPSKYVAPSASPLGTSCICDSSVTASYSSASKTPQPSSAAWLLECRDRDRWSRSFSRIVASQHPRANDGSRRLGRVGARSRRTRRGDGR